MAFKCFGKLHQTVRVSGSDLPVLPKKEAKASAFSDAVRWILTPDRKLDTKFLGGYELTLLGTLSRPILATILVATGTPPGGTCHHRPQPEP